MGKESVSEAGKSADEDERRAEGKRRADALRERYRRSDNPSGWFDACYRDAAGDAFLVPWGHETARPELVEWVDRLPAERRKGRALDVACGLGDNAALLARAGFDVTAFDISPTAVEWASSRFEDLSIEWRAADLLSPPENLKGVFDLVNETYTLQALRPPFRERAFGILPEFLAPHGTLLIIGRGRHSDEPEDPPPWPLLREEMALFEGEGLREVSFEDFMADRKGRPVRHFRAEYRRG